MPRAVHTDDIDVLDTVGSENEPDRAPRPVPFVVTLEYELNGRHMIEPRIEYRQPNFILAGEEPDLIPDGAVLYRSESMPVSKLQSMAGTRRPRYREQMRAWLRHKHGTAADKMVDEWAAGWGVPA